MNSDQYKFHSNISYKGTKGTLKSKRGKRIDKYSSIRDCIRFLDLEYSMFFKSKKSEDELISFFKSLKQLKASTYSLDKDSLIYKMVGVLNYEMGEDDFNFFYDKVTPSEFRTRYRLIKSKINPTLQGHAGKSLLIDLASKEDKSNGDFELCTFLIEDYKLPNKLWEECCKYYDKLDSTLYLYFNSQQGNGSLKLDNRVSKLSDSIILYRYLIRVVSTRDTPRLFPKAELRVLGNPSPDIRKLYINFLNDMKNPTVTIKHNSFNKKLINFKFNF